VHGSFSAVFVALKIETKPAKIKNLWLMMNFDFKKTVF
jgi:hypothetical protein